MPTAVAERPTPFQLLAALKARTGHSFFELLAYAGTCHTFCLTVDQALLVLERSGSPDAGADAIVRGPLEELLAETPRAPDAIVPWWVL